MLIFIRHHTDSNMETGTGNIAEELCNAVNLYTRICDECFVS